MIITPSTDSPSKQNAAVPHSARPDHYALLRDPLGAILPYFEEKIPSDKDRGLALLSILSEAMVRPRILFCFTSFILTSLLSIF